MNKQAVLATLYKRLDKALLRKDSSEADGNSDYDYFSGVVVGIELSIEAINKFKEDK